MMNNSEGRVGVEEADQALDRGVKDGRGGEAGAS